MADHWHDNSIGGLNVRDDDDDIPDDWENEPEEKVRRAIPLSEDRCTFLFSRLAEKVGR